MGRQGFTIVEIMTVIVVLAILAAVSAAGYAGWRQSTARTELVNDLKAAASAMDSFRTFRNGYPMALPDDYQKSDNVTATLKYVTSSDFCIEATTRTSSGMRYIVKKTDSEPKEGSCGSVHTASGESTTSVAGVVGSCQRVDTVAAGIPPVCVPVLQP